MNRLKELQETFLAKHQEQKALLEKNELTTEERDRVKSLESELDALEADLAQAKEFADIQAKSVARAALVTAPVTTLPHPSGNGTAVATPERKTWAVPRGGGVKSFRDSEGRTKEQKAFEFGSWWLATRGFSKSRQVCDDLGLDYKTYMTMEGVQTKVQMEAVAEAGGLTLAG